ncbi:MAG: hypothetical protein K6T17_02660 [Fimbriimonadales bacterium]|nr:hypothetical protein [Fimbriimonadales bacterium]
MNTSLSTFVMENLESALDRLLKGESRMPEYHSFVTHILALLIAFYADQHTKNPDEFLDRAGDFLEELLVECDGGGR